MDLLFDASALDVTFTPLLMKKNRPASQLTVICKPEDREKMEKVIFENTSTIGLRYCTMERSILKREEVMVTTKYGDVVCKKNYYQEMTQIYPEFESVKALARQNNVPYKTVYNEAVRTSRREN